MVFQTLLLEPLVVYLYLVLDNVAVRFTHQDDMVFQRVYLDKRRTVPVVKRHAFVEDVQELEHAARLIVVHLLEYADCLYDVRDVVQVLV